MAAYGIQSQSYDDYLEKHPNLNFPKFTELAHPSCGHFGDGAALGGPPHPVLGR